MSENSIHKKQYILLGNFVKSSAIAEKEKAEGSRVSDSPLLKRPEAKKYYPMRAARFCFFTRHSGRTETYGCLLSSPGDKNRGHDINKTDPESFFESVGKSIGVAHTTG